MVPDRSRVRAEEVGAAGEQIAPLRPVRLASRLGPSIGVTVAAVGVVPARAERVELGEARGAAVDGGVVISFLLPPGAGVRTAIGGPARQLVDAVGADIHPPRAVRVDVAAAATPAGA